MKCKQSDFALSTSIGLYQDSVLTLSLNNVQSMFTVLLKSLTNLTLPATIATDEGDILTIAKTRCTPNNNILKRLM